MTLGLGAPTANAALLTVTGGKSDLTIDIGTVGTLAGGHVYQLILPPATVVYSFAPVATFPITGGTVEDTTMLGTVDHAGGIRTVKCSTTCDAGYDAQLDATNLRILNGNTLTADTNGLLTSPIADLVNVQHHTSPDGTIRFEADATLNAGAALVLNVYFSTGVFVAGMPLFHMKSVIETTTSYHHHPPASAPTFRTALVPVFKPCGTPGNPATGSHAGPLATGSCAPGRSGGVTAHFGPQSVGSARYQVVPPDEDGNDADVSILASLSDVQTAGGGDYDPSPGGSDLTLATRLRLTDTANGPGSDEGATVDDVDLGAPVDCASTSDPAVGAACTTNTTANAVLPGSVGTGRQAIMQMFRVRLSDSGANGVRGDGDDAVFAQQGLFAP
jgi:hypothetical protein